MKLRQLNPSKQRLYTALALSLCLHSATASEHAGQVVSVSGKVLIRSESSQTMQMTFLKPGDKILKGSIVNTGSNGSAKLMMTDKTIIDLGPSSLFRVNEYQLKGGADRKVDVSVDYGQIRANVNQKLNSDKGKFTIRTKAATMGVRGTEFVVNAGLQQEQGPGGRPQTSVTVIEGRVDVADLKTPNAPVRIEPGMQFVKAGDAAPKIARLDLRQLSQVRTEAFQKDMTFLQAVVIEPASEQNSAPPAPPANGVREKIADRNSPEADRATDRATDQKADQKTDQKTAASESGDVKGPAPASAPPPPPTGNLTMRAVVANVTLNTGAMLPINVTDLRLPGVIAAPVVPPQGIQILQGLPRNLQINFNPN